MLKQKRKIQKGKFYRKVWTHTWIQSLREGDLVTPNSEGLKERRKKRKNKEETQTTAIIFQPPK